MATFDAILVPASQPTIKVTINSASSSTEQALPPNTIFAVVGDNDLWLRFGPAGAVPDATTSDFYVPAKSIITFDTGRSYPSFKLFNSAAGAANAYIQLLSRI